MVATKSDRKLEKHTARFVPRCPSRPASDMYAKFSAGLHDPRHIVAFQLLFCGTTRTREARPHTATLPGIGKSDA